MENKKAIEDLVLDQDKTYQDILISEAQEFGSIKEKLNLEVLKTEFIAKAKEVKTELEKRTDNLFVKLYLKAINSCLGLIESKNTQKKFFF